MVQVLAARSMNCSKCSSVKSLNIAFVRAVQRSRSGVISRAAPYKLMVSPRSMQNNFSIQLAHCMPDNAVIIVFETKRRRHSSSMFMDVREHRTPPRSSDKFMINSFRVSLTHCILFLTSYHFCPHNLCSIDFKNKS